MTPLVDADGLIYAAGFATQKRRYSCHAYNKAGDHVASEYFENAADAKEWCNSMGNITVTEKSFETESVSHALQIVKRTLQNIHNKFGAQPRVFLRHRDQLNHRFELFPDYKGNRNQEKPIHYDAIHEYMVNNWYAIQIMEHEVDDEIAVLAHQMGKYYVVCSPDKDLDQIPGWHYNYRNDTDYYVTKEDAEWWFWFQLLAGDSADNIPGCWRVGSTKAKKILDMHYGSDDLWREVVFEYARAAMKESCPEHLRKDPPRTAWQQAQLVYLRKEPGVNWEAPYEVTAAEVEEETGYTYKDPAGQEEAEAAG